MNKEIEKLLFSDLAQIIEQGKQRAVAQVNSSLTLTYWYVGKKINDHILKNERAEYGKEIVSTLSTQLVEAYGKSFESKNLYRMMRFAEVFSEFLIVAPAVRQLSWSHFLLLIPLKTDEARLFYAQKAIEGTWSKRELRRQIERKAFERTEIANTQISVFKQAEAETSSIFKDPYFLDFLGLKDGYLEKDLEAGIIKELEHFILELGVGFSFIER